MKNGENMNENIEKHNLISSLFWKFLERAGAQVISFVILIILTRLISPNQFGVLAIVTVFTNFANVFITGGLGASLVQKKDTDELDYTSIFYVSLIISIIFFLGIFFFSPLISRFYEVDSLSEVLKVLSITLLFGPFNTVQEAYLQKERKFKKQLIVTLIAVIISGSLGIISALNDFGIWALVIQQISFSIIKTIALFIVVRWIPKFIFSFQRVKVLYSFGWKILVGNLLNVLSKDVRTLFIGHRYTNDDLAFYNKGEQIPSLLITNINGSIQSVLLPTLSIYQDDKNEIKSKTRRSVKTSSFIVIPMMFGLAIVAKPLVILLFTEQWLFSVPYIQILSFSFALYPIHTANIQAINAIGRSDVTLKLEIIKVVISIVLLVLMIPYGVLFIAVGALISGLLSSFLNAYPSKKLLKYTYKEQFKDLSTSIVLSSLMVVIIFPLKFFIHNNIVLLLTQSILGLIVYVFLSYIFKVESFLYLSNTAKEYVSSLKNRKDT